LPDGLPVFEVTRIASTGDRRVIDVAVNVLGGYQWRLVYELDETRRPEVER